MQIIKIMIKQKK